MYFTLEDGNENCIERLYRIDEVIEFVKTHDSVKEVFLFCNDEVIASWLSENFNLPFTLMACTHGYGMGNIYDSRKLK